MKKIQPTKKQTGKIKPVRQDTNLSVPIMYTEYDLCLHEQKASGKIGDEETEYTVHFGYNGTFYVELKECKGNMPKFSIDVKLLVQMAYHCAKQNDLLDESE